MVARGTVQTPFNTSKYEVHSAGAVLEGHRKEWISSFAMGEIYHDWRGVRDKNGMSILKGLPTTPGSSSPVLCVHLVEAESCLFSCYSWDFGDIANLSSSLNGMPTLHLLTVMNFHSAQPFSQTVQCTGACPKPHYANLN